MQNKSELNELSELLSKYLKYWKYILVSLVISLSIAFIYIKLSSPVYHVKANILVSDDKSDSKNPSIMKSLGINFGNSQDIYDELYGI